ncbi:MAG: ATP synthase F1 subunit gamma [Candidatus Schekmanbacteria bacterium]|nr:ATP synthase F1 subunit gamma [Candidatus Schekmanbacteria bacterium]
MPNLRDILRRRRSVQSTRQITRAMKMVAAAKLRKAQSRVQDARHYESELDHLVASLLYRDPELSHPFVRPETDPQSAVHVVVLTADRGLCGGYNANVLRAVRHHLETTFCGRKSYLSAVGRKAIEHYRKLNIPVLNSWENVLEQYTPAQAGVIAEDLKNSYLDGTCGELWIAYTQFVSAVSQRVRVERLLPIQPQQVASGLRTDHLFSPDRQTVCDEVLKRYLSTRVFVSGLEAYASVQGARMTAMENATSNATEMIAFLTLSYNRARQAAITKEIIEIASGADAVSASS